MVWKLRAPIPRVYGTDLNVAEPTLREQIRPAILILYLTESNSIDIDRHPGTGKI
jgi:hypothetical protein